VRLPVVIGEREDHFIFKPASEAWNSVRFEPRCRQHARQPGIVGAHPHHDHLTTHIVEWHVEHLVERFARQPAAILGGTADLDDLPGGVIFVINHDGHEYVVVEHGHGAELLEPVRVAENPHRRPLAEQVVGFRAIVFAVPPGFDHRIVPISYII